MNVASASLPTAEGPVVPMSTTLTRLALAGSAMMFAASLSLHAQGILTVTPSPTAATIAGTGALGYTGDGGAASSATLASPSAVAFDANGNLYIADAQNHVVREISKSAQITILAGNGVEGFGGDGAAATSASLDTPTGVAVDTGGNIYIADSHNHRIRMVHGGTITTIAGTGTAGFAGDGGAATSAVLSLPSAVAVDASGNVYIADTNNQRIRKITGTTITTIAGAGEELFAGDGGPATSAGLDLPAGIAVDSSGNVYIADRHNQRVRMIAAADGTISTIAGSGAASFSGDFSGDGSTATSATLARPSGVSVDAAGNIYIADTDNQRIRQVGGGAIVTVAGGDTQGFGGDGGAATSALLNQPKAVAPDASGNLVIADMFNQRIRAAGLPTLVFPSQASGIASTPQSATLANTGSASISISAVTFSGPFTSGPGGTCPAPPILLAAGTNCTQNISFLPNAAGTAKGSVVFSGTGVVPQTILLAGASVTSTTSMTLTSNAVTQLAGQPVTFTATVKPAGLGSPSGSVSFYDGSSLIGVAQMIAGGSASLTPTTLAAGKHSITAAYSGDPSFTGSSSAALLQLVEDFNFAFAPNSGGSTNQTVIPGQAATFAFTVQPTVGAFDFPVTLSATGLPPGATATFTPKVVAPGASAVSFTMTIQTVASTSSVRSTPLFSGGTIAFAFLLLPLTCLRRGPRQMRSFLFGIMLCAGLATITGCGSGFFAQPQQSYNINVIGAASGSNGATLQRTTTVTLTVQ
jgi:sugar lactone lactonase YvrE